MFRHRSPEINTGQGVEWGEEAKDFYDYFSSCQNEVSYLLRHYNRELIVGPKYKTYTSSGIDVESFTLFFQDNRSDSNECKDFFIFSFDKNGVFLGFRIINITNDVASGVIASRFRGKGISSAIDLVTMDILQAELNNSTKNTNLTWRIINQNLNDLADLNIMYELDELSNEDIIEQKKKEQKRWLALYGGKGSLGATEGAESKEYYKKFEKKPEVVDSSNENYVRIERGSNADLDISKRTVDAFIDKDEAIKIKQRRIEMLKKFILDSSPKGSMVIDLRSEYE